MLSDEHTEERTLESQVRFYKQLVSNVVKIVLEKIPFLQDVC